MSRRKKTFTIVSVEHSDIALVSLSYESVEAVRDAIAMREPDQGQVLIFEGEPIPYAVNTKPTVTIGAPRVRAKKATAGKPGRNPKAPVIGMTRDDGSGKASVKFAPHDATDME